VDSNVHNTPRDDAFEIQARPMITPLANLSLALQHGLSLRRGPRGSSKTHFWNHVTQVSQARAIEILKLSVLVFLFRLLIKLRL